MIDFFGTCFGCLLKGPKIPETSYLKKDLEKEIKKNLSLESFWFDKDPGLLDLLA